MLGICMIAQPSFLFNGRCETFLFGTKPPQAYNETYNGTSPYKIRTVHYDQTYYLGVLVAATASVSRGFNIVIIAYLSNNKTTKPVTLTALYAGICGIFIALIGAAFVNGQKLVSTDIINCLLYTSDAADE